MLQQGVFDKIHQTIQIRIIQIAGLVAGEEVQLPSGEGAGDGKALDFTNRGATEQSSDYRTVIDGLSNGEVREGESKRHHSILVGR